MCRWWWRLTGPNICLCTSSISCCCWQRMWLSPRRRGRGDTPRQLHGWSAPARHFALALALAVVNSNGGITTTRSIAIVPLTPVQNAIIVGHKMWELHVAMAGLRHGRCPDCFYSYQLKFMYLFHTIVQQHIHVWYRVFVSVNTALLWRLWWTSRL